MPEYEQHIGLPILNMNSILVYWFTNIKFINQKSGHKMCLYIDRNNASDIA
ncbi:hypothetical protein LTSESEN_6564 [Salmonella enterica subsp. enterica serovar Senftenberg str. A4-543]|uniref:Uncharacterized protein n=1 Tax=Salmonella enterica subsp. enterica serovar Senftenberg str. A4-543 TaxID=913082 RepID=G5R9L1_SALSE|nr:hypothetical protein LTSESEN_6564 [Salmonella enterica subsp. enterica serovar Senftenberg str. A4-543]